MNTYKLDRCEPGIWSTTISIVVVTTASPSHARLASRRFPSRKAAASPTTLRLSTNGMSIPSTNVIAIAMSQ